MMVAGSALAQESVRPDQTTRSEAARSQAAQELIIAEPDPLDDSVTVLPEVVVQRDAFRNLVRRFVGDVTTEDEPNAQVARFDERVCPGVVNIQRSAAEIINDQIARAALTAGLPVGGPGCSPNILVVFVRDSDTFAPALVAANPLVFEYHVREIQGGLDLISQFERPGRAVRWWHLTALEDVGYGASRLRAQVETHIVYSLIIVDLDRLGSTNLGTLGDYIAMAALARLSPDARTDAVDTILNLFGQDGPNAGAPPQLTEWDAAYLQAVYSAHVNGRSRGIAEDDIAFRMRQALTTPIAGSDEATTGQTTP